MAMVPFGSCKKLKGTEIFYTFKQYVMPNFTKIATKMIENEILVFQRTMTMT